MVNRSKARGTAGETAVVRYLQAHGWPHAERRQLRGRLDAGDVTGCPGLCFEVKAGDAARNASDALIVRWLAETETERVNASADIGILVVARLRQPVGRWWAVLPTWAVVYLGGWPSSTSTIPARFHLADLCRLLVDDGFGDDPPARVVEPLLRLADRVTQRIAARNSEALDGQHPDGAA